MSPKPSSMQIVIAWADMGGMRETGRLIERDRNWFPQFKPCLQGHACMWLNEGTEEDLENAKRYARDNAREVFVFNGEDDPLMKARNLAVKNAEGRS